MNAVYVQVMEIQKNIIDWERKNYIPFPWRETDNKFHALIAELMLQRTKANQVVEIFNEFTKKFPLLENISKQHEEEIRKILSPLGLNWRIEKIVALIYVLQEHGRLPDNYQELVRLPGVGDYVASAFLSFHMNQCHPIIDSNAIRLWGRVFGVKTSPSSRRNKEFIALIKTVTPTNNCSVFNYGVLDISRKICKLKPNHDKCPLKQLCKSF